MEQSPENVKLRVIELDRSMTEMLSEMAIQRQSIESITSEEDRPNVNVTVNEFVAQYSDRTTVCKEHKKLLDQNAQWGKGGLKEVTSGTNANYHRLSHEEMTMVELSPENRVTLEELTDPDFIGMVWSGRYFLGRTISPAMKTVSIDVVVEDPEGVKTVQLSLFNYSPSAKPGSNLQDVLPLGMTMVIKNPFYTRHLGKLHLRCDNPAEIHLISSLMLRRLMPQLEWKGISPFHLQHSSPEKCKDKDGNDMPFMFWDKVEKCGNETKDSVVDILKTYGNKAFVEKRNTDAVRFYDLALEWLQYCDEDSKLAADIHANKAAALLRLGCFYAVDLAADQALAIDSAHHKAIYRKVKAFIMMGETSAARAFLVEKIVEIPSLKDNVELTYLMARIPLPGLPKFEEIGAYAYAQAQGRTFDTESCPQERRSAEVQTLVKEPWKGRGLVAIEAIRPGDTILSARSLAMFPRPFENARFDQEIVTDDFRTKPINYRRGHSEVVEELANKMTFDSIIAYMVNNLYAGTDHPVITEHLKFQVDMARLDSIVSFNSFDLRDEIGMEGRYKAENNRPSAEGCGLWYMPSFLNHSCFGANAIISRSGDMIFLRAVRRIPKGNEILINYTKPNQPFSQRDELFRALQFRCNCPLCELERFDNDKVIAVRDECLKFYQEIFAKSLNCAGKKLKDAMEKFDKLLVLRTDCHLNMYLLSPLILDGLLKSLFKAKRFGRAIKVLRSLYAVVTKYPIMYKTRCRIVVYMLKAYMHLGVFRDICHWTLEVRAAYFLGYGVVRIFLLDEPDLEEELQSKFGIDAIQGTVKEKCCLECCTGAKCHRGNQSNQG